MAANLLKSAAIKTLQAGGKSISVNYATETSAWKRAFIAESLKNEFADVVQENVAQLPAGTATVAIKESEHQSESDNRRHYTAFCQDANGEPLPTQHFIKQK